MSDTPLPADGTVDFPSPPLNPVSNKSNPNAPPIAAPEGTVDLDAAGAPVALPSASAPVAASDATVDQVARDTKTEVALPPITAPIAPSQSGTTLDAVVPPAPERTSSIEALSRSVLDATVDVKRVGAARLAATPHVNSVTFSLANLPEGDIPDDWEHPMVAGYEILGVLGRGAMGVVYKARQRGIKRVVALKMILAGGHASEVELGRFRTEAEAVGQLQHPNIVQVYEVGDHDGCPYFSLEYVNGGSLQGKLEGNPQPVFAAAQMVQVLAQAMDCAHRQGIIHRDLKPANVMLMLPRGGGSVMESAVSAAPLVEQFYGVPKVADFGLAKRLEEESTQTRSGAILGTPSYMAPEQAEGMSKEVGPLADQYALGAILYEMLTGRPPFRGATVWETLDQVRTQEPVPPSRLQPKVPRDLETICLKCLQKEPNKRYADGAALAEDLRRFVAGEPILARPVSGLERLWRWCRRHPGVASLSAAVAVLLVAVAVGSTIFAVEFSREKDAALKAEKQAETNERLAKDNEAKAVAAQKDASRQAQNAMGTIYDVVTTADEKLRTRPDMGPLRKQLLQLVMKRLDKISGDAVTSGKADRTMGVALQRMGTFYNQMGMTPQEIEVYKRSLVIFDRLMREHPNEDWNAFDAAISYDNLGEIGREIEPDPAKLFEPYLKGLALRRALVNHPHQFEPSLSKRQRALATSYVKLAMLSLAIGDPASAADYGHEAIRQSEAIAAGTDGEMAQRREVISSAYFMAAGADLHMGREDQARAEYRQCQEMRAKMVHADATNAYAKQELARVFLAIGDLEMETHHLPTALRRYHEGQDLFAQLAAKDRSNLELQWYLANANYALATALGANGEGTAHALYESTLKTRRDLSRVDPKNPQRKIELMLTLARLGHDTEAATLARDIIAYGPRHPGMLFAAASTYALCGGQASTSERKSEYLTKSADILRQAVKRGYRDAFGMANDPNLEPLRVSPAFRAVQAQLAAR